MSVLGNNSATFSSICAADQYSSVGRYGYFSATHGYMIATVVRVWILIIGTDTFMYNEFFFYSIHL